MRFQTTRSCRHRFPRQTLEDISYLERATEDGKPWERIAMHGCIIHGNNNRSGPLNHSYVWFINANSSNEILPMERHPLAAAAIIIIIIIIIITKLHLYGRFTTDLSPRANYRSNRSSMPLAMKMGCDGTLLHPLETDANSSTEIRFERI